jgi:hypothetical protein
MDMVIDLVTMDISNRPFWHRFAQLRDLNYGFKFAELCDSNKNKITQFLISTVLLSNETQKLLK